MSEIKNNVSYILVPFIYKGKQSFNSYITNIQQLQLNKVAYDAEVFLGFVDAIWERASYYETVIDNQIIQIQCFDTGMGFVIFKELFDNEVYKTAESVSMSVKEMALSIEKKENKVFNNLVDVLGDITVFPAGGKQRCLTFNMLIDKVSNSENLWIRPSNSSVIRIDKMHEFYTMANSMTVISNQHYSNLVLKDEDRLTEQNFRNLYENNLLNAFMMLHHERQMYLYLRERIVIEKNSKDKIIKEIKKQIMDVLTCYSFKIVTENEDFQQVYNEYKSFLNLEDYEKILSDLVFRLDDEIDKGKEKRITLISFVITILGLMQLITVVRDIIKMF